MIDEMHRVFLLRDKKIASKIWHVIRIRVRARREPAVALQPALAFHVDANIRKKYQLRDSNFGQNKF